ncbi:MAG: glycoside hydrolase family 9 protein [Pleurocapsa sp.]
MFKTIKAVCLALLMFLMTVMPLRGTTAPNYGEALQKSILFYEAQQAGKLPEWNRVPWRGDSVLKDGADVGVDLSGGWFDAGDNVKFGLPIAATVTLLSWGGIEYYDAYEKSGQLVHLSQNIKWATDYLLNAFANDTPGNYIFYGQVSSGERDHQWWGAAEVVDLEMERPAYKIDTSCPGTELAAESAAAMASASILFRQNGDRDYADLLVQKAERLYDFADKYRGVYSDCLTEALPHYKSFSGYQDELPWGAIWLHKAKKAQNQEYYGEYLDKAIAEYQVMSKPYNYTLITDDKSYGVYVLLAQETGEEEYKQKAEAWLDFWTVGHQGERIKYTPGGLAFLVKWASLTLAANTSFVGFIYSDWLKTQGEIAKAQRYFNFGVSQINYILGNNPSKRSYLMGYGRNYPRNPHHRTAHGSWLNSMGQPTDNRNLLIGALVGGPDESDRWKDDRGDWVHNEVAIGYNAGLAGALARMYLEFGGESLSEISFPTRDEPSIYVEHKIHGANQKSTAMALTIVNKSASPARGLDNATVRVFYQIDPDKAENIAAVTNYNECNNSPAAPVKIKDGLYYVAISCQGTAIYPGGESKYKKKIELQLINNSASSGLFNNFAGMFVRPLKVTNFSLYNHEELIWGNASM